MPTPTPPCSERVRTTRRFEHVEPLSLDTVEREAFPRLTEDELTIVLEVKRAATNGHVKIWQADRPRSDVPFGDPTPLSTLGPADADEYYPTISADGLELVFSSVRSDGLGGGDLYLATRPSRDAAFGAATRLPVSTAADESTPFLRGDELWFDRDGRIMLSRRLAGGTFTTAAAVSELASSNGSDSSPALSADGLAIWFASSRDVDGGAYHPWTATRENASAQFTNIRRVTELDLGATVYLPGWMSTDGCRFYVTMYGGPRDLDVAVATRTPK
jgi:Tol biopolymer transport system component